MTHMILSKLSGEDKIAKIGKILIKVGQQVHVGDSLFNAESSKGNFTVKSEYEGTILKLLIEEGKQIKIGDSFAEIEGNKVSAQPTKSNKETTSYSFGLAKPKKEDIACDIVVIGGGPGGYVSAIKAAQLGGKVVLIEKDKVGGTCLNYGCIPTKSYVKSAHLSDEIRESSLLGIKTGSIDIDLEKIVQRKEQVIGNLSKGIHSLLDYWNIRYLSGEAKATNNTITVKNNRVDATITAKNIILANGSSPAKLDIKGANLPVVMTNEEILNITQIPKSITVIGGGVIGMEFAFIFNSFGSKVTVIEYLDDILFHFDQDVIDVILNECQERGIQVFTQSKVEEIALAEDGQGITTFQCNGEKHFAIGEKILMAVGRKPNLDSIDLEELKVSLNERGNGIQVDEHMLTSNPAIYAIGDVTNIMQLAHVASHQGIVAAENCMGQDSSMDYTAIPSAVFVSPEIGVVGMTEKEAEKKNIAYRVSKFPFAANGKALSQGETKGFVKVISKQDSYEIIGAAVIGSGATDLISNFTYFIQHKIDYRTIHHTVFAHPTTAETVHEAILGLTKEAIHLV